MRAGRAGPITVDRALAEIRGRARIGVRPQLPLAIEVGSTVGIQQGTTGCGKSRHGRESKPGGTHAGTERRDLLDEDARLQHKTS